MSGTGSGSVAEKSTDELPRIVEETSGDTLALTKAWVTFNGMKFVLALTIDDAGNVLDGDDEWCTVEITNADGSVTYNDTSMDKAPREHQAWIWTRLEEIYEGKAESGPLFKDGLPRVASDADSIFALTPAWVTYDDTRYVLLQNLDKAAELEPESYEPAIESKRDDIACYRVIEPTSIDGSIDRINKRLTAIMAGTAESGPLE